MEQWYALHTVSGKEQEAGELLKRVVSHKLWISCQIPKKIKVFRSGGILHLLEGVMFPGYLFVKTADSEGLLKVLQKARKFPQFTGSTKGMLAPVEEKDLHFLQDVCGKELQQVMGVTRIALNGENQVIRAEGVLGRYLDRIVKLNLHKRFAIVEVELFNRNQAVLFGISLDQDRLVQECKGKQENLLLQECRVQRDNELPKESGQQEYGLPQGA